MGDVVVVRQGPGTGTYVDHFAQKNVEIQGVVYAPRSDASFQKIIVTDEHDFYVQENKQLNYLNRGRYKDFPGTFPDSFIVYGNGSYKPPSFLSRTAAFFSGRGGSSTKRKIHTGPKGGKFYIKKGRKVYV